MAGALVFSLLAPMFASLAPLASAAGPTVGGGVVTLSPAQDVEKPTVVIEANAVYERGAFTGYLEAGLRVYTPVVYTLTDGTKTTTAPEGVDPSDNTTWTDKVTAVDRQTFRSLATSLKYNADILTPVTWDITGPDGLTSIEGVEITVDGSTTPITFPSKKLDQVGNATATLTAGSAADPVTGTGKTGLLYFMVENAQELEFSEDPTQGTLLGVVRFKYDLEKYTPKVGGKGSYISTTGTGKVSNVPDADWFDTTKENWLLTFATDEEIFDNPTALYAGQQTVYTSGETTMYWSDVENSDSSGTLMTKNYVPWVEKIEGGAVKKDQKQNLLRKANGTEPETYTPTIRFQLANEASFDRQGGGDQAIVLYYDWNNVLIGVQGVAPGDARAEVNAFVEEHFIAPDLRASTKQVGSAEHQTLVDSVARKDTYRDEKYPAEGPGGTTTYSEGDNYPLTNKLDYAFYTHPTAKKYDSTTNTTIWTPMTEADWSAATDETGAPVDQGAVEYPYTNGWAVVPEKNVRNDTIDDIWTTFGVGELRTCAPMADRDTSTLQPFETKDKSAYFQFQDFSNLEKQVYYVKACYEPGASLSTLDYQPVNPTPEGVRYLRYGSAASEGASAYAMEFQYQRAYNNYGVVRTRDPAFLITYTPDQNGKNGKSFFGVVHVDNNDIMDILITPSGSVKKIQYRLVDQYELTYVTGTPRSPVDDSTKLFKLKENFGIYENYADRFGTDGFVFYGTLNQILEEGAKYAAGEIPWATYQMYFDSATFTDLNFKGDKNGGDIPSYFAAFYAEYIKKALDDVYKTAGGDTNPEKGKSAILALDWHQLQYALCNSGNLMNGNQIMSKYTCVAKLPEMGKWCRLGENGQHDGCADGNLPGGVEDLPSLLKAIAADDPAQYNLSKTFDLRRPTASCADQPYETNELDTLRSDLRTKVINASGIGDYTTLSWEKVQFLLLGGSVSDLNSVNDGDYWWKDGGTLEITDIPTLLEAADKVYNQNYDTSWLDDATTTTMKALKLRASTAKTNYDFTNDADVKAALQSAVQKLKEADVDFSTVSAVELQHLLLKDGTGAYNTYKGKVELEKKDGVYARVNYWWLYDAPNLATNKNIDALMEAAWIAHKGSSTAWTSLNATLLSDLYLAKSDKNGAPYEDFAAGTNKFTSSSDLNTFKSAMESLVTKMEGASPALSPSDYISWKTVQNALLHSGEYKADSELDFNSLWWLPASEGNTVTNGLRPNPMTTLNEYLLAAQKADTTALDKITPGGIKALYLAKTNTQSDGTKADGDTFNDLQHFTDADLDDFKASLSTLVTDHGTNLTWKEVQYYLIFHAFLADNQVPWDHDGIFWSQTGTGSRPASGAVEPTPTPTVGPEPITIDLDETSISWTLAASTGSTKEEKLASIKAQMEPADIITAMHLLKPGADEANPTAADFYKPEDIDALAEKVYLAYYNRGRAYRGFKVPTSNDLSLPWNYLQYFILKGAHYARTGLVDYTWKVDAGEYVPSGGGTVTVPIDLDETSISWTLAASTGSTKEEKLASIKAQMEPADIITAMHLLKPGADEANPTAADFYKPEDIDALAEKVYLAYYNRGRAYRGFKTPTSNDLSLPWNYLQYFILKGTHYARTGLADYAWKATDPAYEVPAGTASLSSPTITSQRILSRTEDTEVTTDSETTFDEATGDVTIVIVNTSVTTVVTTLETGTVTSVTTVVTTTTIQVDGVSHQASTTTDVTSDTQTTVDLDDPPVPSAEPTDVPPPVSSAVPIETDAPAENAGPAVSQAPAENVPESEDPVEPETPTETEAPTETETPSGTGTPSDTERPIESEDPVEPATPAEETTTPTPTDPPQESGEVPPGDTLRTVSAVWLRGLVPRKTQTLSAKAAVVQRC